jgi:hypothetical protein
MKLKLILAILIPFLTCTISAQDKATEFNFCNEVRYSAVDFQLKRKYGDLLEPGTNSKFVGGIEQLKKYFAENPLTNPKSKGIVFRTHIGFVVNCNGKAGNFEIVSDGKGDLKILSENVLEIIQKMPQNWEAAKVNGENVDSYQILSFTIIDGVLTKVNYR